jgi:hypothetical protein
VSCRLVPTFSKRLIIFLPRSGRRKECSLVCGASDTFFSIIYGVDQFHDHPGDRVNAKMRACITRILLL